MARKILFYTHAFGGGGAEIVFRRLATSFAEGGDDVIFAADHAGPSAIANQPGLRHVLLGVHHWRSIRQLATLLRREKPDASFSALGVQNIKHLIAAMIAGRRNHCVLGYHGFAEAEPKFLSRLSFVAAPLITRLAAQTICVSDALRESLCHRWHASRKRTIRIYNPVLLPPIKRTHVPNKHLPLILACGRLVRGKRFGDLVAALALVTPPTSRLAILGEGPERRTIETAIGCRQLEDRVELPGHVENMSEWYARADCLAISSESESFGLTAAEALAHGVPVVSTECGGPAEILDGGLYGRIVPVGDIEALAQGLSETLKSPGEEGPRRTRAASFAIDAIHRRYAELIDALPQA